MTPFHNNSETTAVIIVDGRPDNSKLFPQLIRCVCSLANTKGGIVYIVRRSKNPKFKYNFIV